MSMGPALVRLSKVPSDLLSPRARSPAAPRACSRRAPRSPRDRGQRHAEECGREVASRAADLVLRQRPEMQYLHTPRQGVRHPGQREHVRRSREEETAWRAVLVHCELDGEQKFGRALHLVDDDALREAADETLRIQGGCAQHTRVVEREVRCAGLRLLVEIPPPSGGCSGCPTHAPPPAAPRTLSSQVEACLLPHPPERG